MVYSLEPVLASKIYPLPSTLCTQDPGLIWIPEAVRGSLVARVAVDLPPGVFTYTIGRLWEKNPAGRPVVGQGDVVSFEKGQGDRFRTRK